MDDIVEKIYKRKFGPDVEFRQEMYKVLYRDFLRRYIPKNAVLLDVAAGYCPFINNIEAGRKIAVDMNADIRKFASNDVEVVVSKSTDMRKIKDKSVDVVFTSNLFEHLNRADIVKTIREVKRVLKKDGRFLIIQPNYRFCYRDYWMFFDHITPLDDRSMCEILEINGFRIEECKPRFLPYTSKGNLPKSLTLLRLYLRLPSIMRVFGGQMFIYASKEGK
jgi:SAM-dependent methyltransferase